MLHAREDYNRIQDPALDDPSLLGPGCNPIGLDEPVFLLRAKDVLAPGIVEEWADRYEAREGNSNTVERVRLFAQHMRHWQEKNGSKMADCPYDEGEDALPAEDTA